jgi:aminoglycoside phosphotransferase (APT) family kinase protein
VTDPTEADARRVTAAALGVEVADARRFTTGLQHFVYEVTLADGRAVVLRMTRPAEREVARNAVRLSRQLRPLGVPLPELLAADVEADTPWMLLERLPGVDLWEVAGTLPDDSLRDIASGVAAAQAVAATMPSSGRFGFAPSHEAAPHASWTAVMSADVDRSRRRIAAAGLFDLAHAERLETVLSKLKRDFDAVPATPFLHDTTTKNVIVTDTGALSGIVDVDDLCFGDPRFVAALVTVALRANGVREDYATYLMQTAGWTDDHLFRFYVAAFLLDFMSEHGQVFNGNQRPSSPEARATLLGLYEAALADL